MFDGRLGERLVILPLIVGNKGQREWFKSIPSVHVSLQPLGGNIGLKKGIKEQKLVFFPFMLIIT